MLVGLLRRPYNFLRCSSSRPMSTILTSRPSNWKAAAPAPLPGTPSFAGQESLPKLPVPELPITLARLKDALRPLAASEAEYAAAVAKIDDFEKGKGKELQERLLKKHADTKHWLENWWDDLGYLGYRDSVCLSRYHTKNTLFNSLTGGRERILLLYVYVYLPITIC